MSDTTPEEKKELVQVTVMLHEAGINLHHEFKPKFLEFYMKPVVGFDFTSDRWKDLQNAAKRNRKLLDHPINMPGKDPWLKKGILAESFSRRDKIPYVHLDVALNRPGLCRAYIVPKGATVTTSKAGFTVETMENKPTFDAIESSLRGFEPKIYLKEHIGAKLRAKRNTLDGVDFMPRDYDELVQALMAAKDWSGKKAFEPGSKGGRGHFPLHTSYAATEGLGLRGIWRPHQSHRPLPTPDASRDPVWDHGHSAYFGNSYNRQDFRSLHCDLSPSKCNIHIDQIGFVMEDANGNVIIDPDSVAHFVNELMVKSKLQGKVPNWALDRFEFHLPSSLLNFSRWGASFDLIRRGNLRLTIRGSCSILGGFSHAETITLGWQF
jgi:hypothetical protein